MAAPVGAATVKTHLQHIFTKLGAADRASAVAVAYRRGIL
ncbi:LuxR C-terminal-related transcriptional regulator [Ruania albidiflava]